MTRVPRDTDPPPAPPPQATPAAAELQRFWSVLRLRGGDTRRGTRTERSSDDRGEPAPPRAGPAAEAPARSAPPSTAVPPASAGRADGRPRPGASVAGAAADPARPGPERAIEALGERICRLCRRAGEAMQSWDVSLALDPAVLPDTELRIRGSRESLRLRFSTSSASASRLLSEHTPRLRRMLEDELDLPGRVDIECL